MSKLFVKIQKFIRTKEDWYPAFKPLWKPNNPNYHNPLNDWAVRVSLHNDGKEGYRVSVWGGDDYGLEKHGLKKGEARDLYAEMKDYITKSELKRRGFVNC